MVLYRKKHCSCCLESGHNMRTCARNIFRKRNAYVKHPPISSHTIIKVRRHTASVHQSYDSDQKRYNNGMFAIGLQNWIRFNGKVCYLEGANAGTTKSLLEKKISGDRLIPITRDNGDYKKLCKQEICKKNQVTPVRTDIDEYLLNYKGDKLSGLYLDYCGGMTMKKYRILEEIFSKNIFNEQVRVAMTFVAEKGRGYNKYDGFINYEIREQFQKLSRLFSSYRNSLSEDEIKFVKYESKKTNKRGTIIRKDYVFICGTFRRI